MSINSYDLDVTPAADKYNLSFRDPSTECVWGLKEVRDSLQTSQSVVINCSLSCTIVKDLWAFE